MECNRCGKKSSDELCDNCLTEVIEKRAKKAIAKAGITNAAVEDDGSCEGRVSSYLAERLISAKKAKKGRNWLIVPETADRKAEKLLEKMLESKSTREKPNQTSIISESMSEEVFRYAKIRKIKYNKHKEHKTDTTKLIEKLEKSHKGTKTALAKAGRQLK
ncbi:hypothetical protein HYU12_01675 [Candidatus Woesearchaeota archaeon]|nr:hypothetical protein [Candidatus Woesearchaeota archaeon]